MNWLRNFWSRCGPSQNQDVREPTLNTFEMLSATERDAIIARHLKKHLPDLGLTEINARCWIDSSRPPVRPMFQLSLLKGAGIKACWGFSLDFVPHVTGHNIRWHRTDRTAMLDVIIDPCDMNHFSFMFGAARLEHELEEYLPTAIDRAKETWRRGETWHGILEILQEIREQKVNCFGFYNYTQHPLAFAFLSAKIGDIDTAETELTAYLQTNRLDENSAMKLKTYMRNLN